MKYILIDELRQQNCISHLLNVELNGKTEVVFRDYKSVRSIQQNRLMWDYYAQLGDFIGLVPEDMHEMMKAKIFGMRELKTKDMDGKPMTLHVPDGTTTKLKTYDKRHEVMCMTKFLQAIEMLAGELGVNLKRPDDYKMIMERK